MSRPTIGLICVFGVVLVVWILPPIFWPGGIGIGKDESVSTKTIEKDKQGNTVKTIETIKYDDGKTFWDWGSLLGVPLSLAILGYFLQQQQQKRTEKLSEDQRRIAENETKEEVLQTYFDRLSVLLIDKNLIAISNKSNLNEINSEEKELLDSALDVIRARTLSILRRFEKDAERKTSVINFLIETEIVEKSKLKLSKANLSGTNLSRANLSGANLSGADLSGADLSEADLSEADLSEADLSGTQLIRANLSGTQLIGAKLIRVYFCQANLSGACISQANLSEADLSEADLSEADLIGVNLSEANLAGVNLFGANISGANINDIKWDSDTTWPDKSKFTNVQNIPEELKKELDITP